MIIIFLGFCLLMFGSFVLVGIFIVLGVIMSVFEELFKEGKK